MTEILFYHLQRQPVEKVLPQLLEKSLERGWRVVVQASSEERIDALDAHLWTYRDDNFLARTAPIARARPRCSRCCSPSTTTIRTARMCVSDRRRAGAAGCRGLPARRPCCLTARTTKRWPPRARAGARQRPAGSRHTTGRRTKTAAGNARPDLDQRKSAGAPVAPCTFGTPAISVAPVGGTCSRLAIFSSPSGRQAARA